MISIQILIKINLIINKSFYLNYHQNSLIKLNLKKIKYYRPNYINLNNNFIIINPKKILFLNIKKQIPLK
jgi:hypothetical protein